MPTLLGVLKSPQPTELRHYFHSRQAPQLFPSSVATTVVQRRQRPHPNMEQGRGLLVNQFLANGHSFLTPPPTPITATATATGFSSNSKPKPTKGRRRLRQAKQPLFVCLPASHLGALRCLPVHAAPWRGRQPLGLRLGYVVHARMPPPRLNVVVGHVLLACVGRAGERREEVACLVSIPN